jgi:Uma2 family endonuclease
MSAALLSPPIGPPLTMRAPRPIHWTCDEFHTAGDAGAFEHKRVMLIEGVILEMPVPNPPHSTSKDLTEDALRAIFGHGFRVRAENPLILGKSTDPVPDLAVVTGSVRDYAQSHPTTAVLVVEISDSSLDYDMGDKASLYASAPIADYWVVDLVNRQLVVMRDPVVDATRRFGFRYSTVTTLAVGQSASPLATPSASIAVADLMP